MRAGVGGGGRGLHSIPTSTSHNDVFRPNDRSWTMQSRLGKLNRYFNYETIVGYSRQGWLNRYIRDRIIVKYASESIT